MFHFFVLFWCGAPSSFSNFKNLGRYSYFSYTKDEWVKFIDETLFERIRSPDEVPKIFGNLLRDENRSLRPIHRELTGEEKFCNAIGDRFDAIVSENAYSTLKSFQFSVLNFLAFNEKRKTNCLLLSSYSFLFFCINVVFFSVDFVFFLSFFEYNNFFRQKLFLVVFPFVF